MKGTRVYLPSTLGRLRAIVVSDGVGPAPFVAHAVTDAVRAELSDGGDEELEYAVAAAAAQSSLELLGDEERPRRVVVAVDVPSARPAGTDDPSLVEVDEVVPLRRVAAVLVDTEDADADVAAAVAARVAGAADADALADRCLDHELAWFATQEIGDLLDQTGA